MSAIQVKNVPEELHDALRRRASDEGIGISDYILSVLRRDLALPGRREWLDRLSGRDAIEALDSVGALALERESRDAELAAARRP